MATRKDHDIAYNAAYKIKEFWKKRKFDDRFLAPNVSVHPGTAEIVSDMVDGLPPRRKRSMAR